MRGKKEGLWVGFFCGLLIDIFCGNYIGLYALIYMYIGFINGLFQKRFYPDDIKLPMLLIGGSDLFYNLVVYFFMFLLRGRFSFLYYLKSIIIPEFVYTMVISILLYLVFLKVNQKLEAYEKRRAKKFDLRYKRFSEEIFQLKTFCIGSSNYSHVCPACRKSLYPSDY